MLQGLCPRLLRVAFFGCFYTLLTATSNAQTAAAHANGQLVLKANAQTVIVDVVVTDRKGRPVEKLRREDFTVAEDGKAQSITSFEEHTGAVSVQADIPELPPNVFVNIPRFKPTDSVTVLLLDSLNTQTQDQIFVRKKMLKYLKDLKPGRRMALFTLGAQLRMIQSFTDDPALLTAALNSEKTGTGPQASPLLQSSTEASAEQQAVANLGKHAAAEAAALKQFLAEQIATQDDQRVKMTLAAFQEIAHYLAGVPGRKNLVWFSSAFPVFLFRDANRGESFTPSREYEGMVKKTDALLAAAQVAVYPIAAEGLASDSLYEAANQLPVTNALEAQTEQTKSLHADASYRNSVHAAMDEIAEDTGGTAFYNTNGLNDALGRVDDHGSHFYTMSYTPARVADDGRFRKIEVKLARSGSGGGDKLAYRRGYYADDAKVLQVAKPTPGGDPLHPFMRYGVPDSTQIPLALRVERGAGPREADVSAQAGDNPKLKGLVTRYAADFIVAASGLQLDAAPNGGRQGAMEAALVAYDRNGSPLAWVVKRVDLGMDAGRYAQVKANGVNFRLEVDVPRDGILLRGGVYDESSKRVGTLEIPLSSVVSSKQSR